MAICSQCRFEVAESASRVYQGSKRCESIPIIPNSSYQLEMPCFDPALKPTDPCEGARSRLSLRRSPRLDFAMASSAAQLGTHRRELTPYSRITLGGLEQTKLPTALRQRHLSILDAETRHLLDPAELWSTAEPTITTSAALLELPCPHPTDLEVLKFVDFPGADYKSLQWQSHLVDITVAPRIWTELISLRDVQTKWLDSLQWLEGRIKRGGDVGRLAALVLEDMRGLKWDEKLKGFADVPGVLTLCRLLGESSAEPSATCLWPPSTS